MRLLREAVPGKSPAVIDIPVALARDALDGLMNELKEAEEDLRVGSIILVFPEVGEGSASLDWEQLFPEFDGVPAETAIRERLADWNRRIEYLRNVYVPVVASLEGRCFGWALELLLAADLVICGEGASIAVEDCPSVVPYRLAWICGTQRLKRLVMLGQVLDAEMAVEWGVANYSVEAGTSMAAASELAERLALPPRDAMSVLKESLNAIEEQRVGAATQRLTM